MKMIKQLLVEIARSGIKLAVDSDSNLRIEGNKAKLTPELIAKIKANKQALVDWSKANSQSESMLDITPYPRDGKPMGLSFAQQRLWFLDQMEGGTPYNIPAAMQIDGVFDRQIAQRTLESIIERHEPLRTVYSGTSNGAVQHIRQGVPFKLVTHDLSDLSQLRQRQAVTQAINVDAAQGFDLTRDLMLRATYLQLSDDKGVLLFCLHHICADGWSFGLLIKEFAALYQAFLQGQTNPLTELTVQYADYVQWQQQWLKGEVINKQLSYWQKQLTDLPLVHTLPLDYIRSPQQSFAGANHGFSLSNQVLAELNQLALAHNVTVFMLLHSAFVLLLSRYANSDDIVVGTTVANRRQKALEALVGLFTNTLVLRVDCSQNSRFCDFLSQVRRIHLDAQANQDVPFE
ncbi:MAG: condensation domain-containing protein, partial [Psychrosphaera sp.]|nr:condensation domain-containing protein [Psychrosphaera sp.]